MTTRHERTPLRDIPIRAGVGNIIRMVIMWTQTLQGRWNEKLQNLKKDWN